MGIYTKTTRFENILHISFGNGRKQENYCRMGERWLHLLYWYGCVLLEILDGVTSGLVATSRDSEEHT